MRYVVAAVLTASLLACARPIAQPQRIVLERTHCFGVCPAYRLTVEANGRVSYEGDGYSDTFNGRRLNPTLPKRANAHLSPTSVAAIFATYDEYWSRVLPNRYVPGQPTCLRAATDHPSVTIIRDWPTRSDTVELYYGCASRPERLIRLAAAIDSLVQIQRWLGPGLHRDPPSNDR